MEDKERKRLTQLALYFMVALFILGIGFIAWASYEIKDLRNTIATNLYKPRDGVKGADGLNGKDGTTTIVTTYVPGKDGKDGQNVTPEQVAAVVYGYLLENPPAPGAQGEPGKDGASGQNGKDGREIELRKSPENPDQLQYRYKGDSMWQDVQDGSQPE